jgi:hypothetical protein
LFDLRLRRLPVLVEPAEHASAGASPHPLQVCERVVVDLSVGAVLPRLLAQVFPIDDDLSNAGSHRPLDEFRLSGEQSE